VDTTGSVEPDRETAVRERRKRINEAFRAGDLRFCLEEITAGLAERPDDGSLGKALGAVQARFVSEVIEPAVTATHWDEAARALQDLQATELPPDLRERVERLAATVGKARIPAEETLDVRDKTLRKAEEAWAAGRKREAREHLKSLNGLPLDDHDLVLRRDGLARLMEQETARPVTEGVQPHTAGRWVVLLLIVAVLAGAAIVVLPGVLRRSAAGPFPAVPVAGPVEAPIEGWLAVSAMPPEAEIHDSTGLILGTAGRPLALPVGPHALTVMAPGYRETTLVARVVAAETTSVAVVLHSTLPTSGLLTVRSSPPGATVLLAGTTRLGVTPLEVSLEFGKHRLLLTAEGKVPEWVEVRIGSGGPADTSVNLWTRYAVGQLQINATPWAFVWIDGDSLGPTPLTTGDLTTGVEHDCVFKRPDGSVLRQRIRLDPKRATPTPLTVGTAAPAILAIATRDSLSGRSTWANVWVGSRLLGETPGEFEVSPGEMTLRVQREGYQPLTRTVVLEQGQRTALSLALEPER
jgi:hypothetical protein